jgi:two-component system chemotaxis response regulator CheY
METIGILVVEDEPEVRDALVRDLAPFADIFRIETAEDVNDARDVVAELKEEKVKLGLVLCDHVLPGTHGVDFLVELHDAPATAATRKVLITGQAGLGDTVKAINKADLHHYIAKPWLVEDLHNVVKTQLTEYALAESENLLPYVGLLDGPRLLDAVSRRQADR